MSKRLYFGANSHDSEERNVWLDINRKFLKIAMFWESRISHKEYGYEDKYVRAVFDVYHKASDGRRNSFLIEELINVISLLETAINCERKFNLSLNKLIDYMYSLVERYIRLYEHEQGLKNLLNSTDWIFTDNDRKVNVDNYATFKKVYLPMLQPMKRYRNYESFDNLKRDEIVYEYLFNSRTCTWLDKKIIKNNNFSAMDILHSIGLKSEHRGILEGLGVKESINLLESKTNDYEVIIECLKRIFEIKGENIYGTIYSDLEAEMSEEGVFYSEGTVKEYSGKRYERNPINRAKAIEIHGLNCKGCGFNFEKVYGEWGKDFIEIHHVNPLCTIKEEVVNNPETDLVPVCSNCHRMIHRRKEEVLTIEELKELIKN